MTWKCWRVLACLLPWGNGSSSVKEAAKHTASNQNDGIHKALEYFEFCLLKKSLSGS